jgi:hypothetical protein
MSKSSDTSKTPIPKIKPPYREVIEYLRKNHKEVADLLEETGVDCRFSCNWHKDGITFLIPSKEQCEALRKSINTTNGFDNAVSALNSLILRGFYDKPSSFGGEVVNLQFPSRVVPIKANGKDILIAEKHVATLAESFKSGCKDNTFCAAMWKLSGSTLPDYEKYAVVQRDFSGKVKRGKYQPSNDQKRSLRFAAMLLTERAYVDWVIKKRTIGCSSMNPFISAVVCILELVNKRGNEGLPYTYNDLLSIVCFDNFDFYLLVGAHDQSEPLVSTSIINAWCNESKQANCCALLKQHQANQMKDTHFKARVEAVQAIRKNPTDAFLGANITTGMANLTTLYGNLEQSNKVHNMTEFWPASIAAYYKKHQGAKMLHDDVRYLSCLRFAKLETDPRNLDFAEANGVFNFIGDALHANTEKERKTQAGLLNIQRLKNLIMPTMEKNEIVTFINSSCFLAVPYGDQTIKKQTTIKPIPGKIAFFNLHGGLYDAYDHIRASEFQSLIETISFLSAEEKKELAKTLNRDC